MLDHSCGDRSRLRLFTSVYRRCRDGSGNAGFKLERGTLERLGRASSTYSCRGFLVNGIHFSLLTDLFVNAVRD
jgi:hypothetical protein